MRGRLAARLPGVTVVAAALALFSPALAAPSGADLARSLETAALDPSECYRVRDLSLIQEDVKLYFNEGYLIFSKPVNGDRVSAVFSADVEGGDGETVLLPPYRSERQSLAHFTNSPNMDEHFRAAVLIFAGGPGKALRDRVEREGHKALEMGPSLAEQWSATMTGVAASFRLRLVEDLLTPPQDRPALLYAAIAGRSLGDFDLLYDGRAREQILLGRSTQRGGIAGYDVWANFPARGSRNAAAARPTPQFTTDRYKIDTDLDANLRLKASIQVSVKIGPAATRVLPFAISRLLRVTSVRIDGSPAELLILPSNREPAVHDTGNDPFLAIAPADLAAGSVHQIEFQQEGSVIAPAGNDVYFVGARSNWYPQSGRGFAQFDLTFKFPKRLTLVSSGDLLEDRIDGDWRITRRATPVPVRFAGFNLGDYLKVESAAPGFQVEVYGNRALESALQPNLLPPSSARPGGRGRPVTHPLPAPAAPDPAARLRSVAADVASALQFYSGLFAGPPRLKSLTVSPIPGNFGQGFPGLVYLSTLAYLNPEDRPESARGPDEQLFYSDLIEAHEVAHQWWGGLVLTDGYQDEWISEALSSYSALLYLEKKKGSRAMEDVLAGYRDHLIRKDTGGRTLESAGPITWGYRLDSDPAPDAWRAITYDKGAWIFHMLRRRIGDDAFFKMLAELRRRFESRPISTADLRALAKEFAPKTLKESSIDTFFDNWVYSTGIPSLKLTYSLKGVAPAVRITGEIQQSGVDDDFSIEAPVEIQFARGAAQTLWVTTATGGSSFSAPLKQAPAKVSIPAGAMVLAH